MIFTGKEFKQQFHSPIVYIWKRGDEWLYIGKSGNGFHRVVYDKYHTTFKKQFIEDTDTIEIIYFDSKKECLDFEQRMIKAKNPIYNFTPGRKTEANPKYKEDFLSDTLGLPTDEHKKFERNLIKMIGKKGIERIRKSFAE